MKNRTATIVVIVVLVLVVIAAFVVYSNPSISSALGLSHSTTPQQSGTASTTRRFNGNRGGFVTGSIESLSDGGFIITMQDGTTKNITTTSTTTIQDFTSASSTPSTITSDQLSVGEQVRVIGAAQSDGSVSASRVMVGTLPIFTGRGGQGGAQPQAPNPQ